MVRWFQRPARLQSLPRLGATRAVQTWSLTSEGLISSRNRMPHALVVAGVAPLMPIEVKADTEQGLP